MDFWRRIRTQWEQEGLPVPSGVTTEELDAFERRYDVALPSSMREYFQVANGSGDMERDQFTFSSLQDVKLVSEKLAEPYHIDRLNYPQCFVFVDWLIWCWGYAIHLTQDSNNDGPVYLIGGQKDKIVVAATFLEFMEDVCC